LFIYDSTGKAVGLIRGAVIHALNGLPVGQMREDHAYSFAGEYVGQLYDGMIVRCTGRAPSNIARLTVSPRSIPPMTAPPVRNAPRHGREDVFKKLVGR
jgi:hypothetical protein